MARKKYYYNKNENGDFECLDCGAVCKTKGGFRKHCRVNSHMLVEDYEKDNSNERLEKIKKEKIEKEVDGNKMTVTCKSHQIKTLDEFLKVTKADLDTWFVDHHLINKWPVGAKHPDTGEIVVQPLWQVKAVFKRRVVKKQDFPFIKPIKVGRSLKRKKTKKDKELKTAMFISDGQVGFERVKETGELKPFHDRKTLDLSVQVAQEENPDLIIIDGDMLDLAEWSTHFARKPETYFTTQAALIELNWWLQQLRKASPHAKIVYIEGNHEERIMRIIIENMKAAAGLKSADDINGNPILSVPNMLGLDKLDIEYLGNYPDNEYWINNQLVCVHGDKVSSVPGKTAGNIVKDTNVSVLMGHSHRLEMAAKTFYIRGGYVIHRVYSMGCMAKVGGLTPGTKQKQNWQDSFGVIKYKEGDGEFEVYPLLVQKGKVIWNDKVFTGKDRLDDIIKDTNWKEFKLKKDELR